METFGIHLTHELEGLASKSQQPDFYREEGESMQRQRHLATCLGTVLGTLCALLLIAAQGHASDRPGKLTEEFHQTYTLAAGGRIELENINGSVHITGWDKNEVKVDAVKTAYSKERLDQATIKVDASKDSVSIRTEYPDRDNTWNNDDQHNPASVEYTLTVPRSARLDEIKLINGSLDIQGVAGEVRAACINGRLAAHGLEGPTKLSNINGRTEAEFDRLGDSIELSSVNGSVELTLPSDSQAKLEASTVHGGIDNDFGLHVNNHQWVGHDLRGELGNGGTRIKLSNVNGGIKIRHASDGRTLSTPRDLSRRENDDL
jgi:Putative adhesin